MYFNIIVGYRLLLNHYASIKKAGHYAKAIMTRQISI